MTDFHIKMTGANRKILAHFLRRLFREVQFYDPYYHTSPAFSSVARSAIAPLIGLSTKMQKKENTTF